LGGGGGPGEGVEVETGKICDKEGERNKEGRKDAQVGLLLRNATLGFTTENDEGTGSVIIANRSILEGRGCGTLKKA